MLASGLLSLAAGAAAPAASAAPRYRVQRLCGHPRPGAAACLAMKLVPASLTPSQLRSSATRQDHEAAQGGKPAVSDKTPTPGFLTPERLHDAYSLPSETVASPTQTVAVVDAFDDPTAEADLGVYDKEFNLPACTAANGCFRKVNQLGNASPLPPSTGALERGWAQEIATDIETAHGICPSCQILLVEAKSNSNANLFAAELTAGNLGATEISNSWGAQEPSSDSAAFNRPGVVITASAGDDGYLNWLQEGGQRFAEYPATSPHVVAVGGTRLSLNASSKAWEAESVWNDGGESGGKLDGHGAGGGMQRSVHGCALAAERVRLLHGRLRHAPSRL